MATIRRVLATGLAVVVAAVTSLTFAADAEAIPPCWMEPIPPPDCPEPPPPTEPGPISGSVVLHDTNEHAKPAAVARLAEVLDRVAAANRARLGSRSITLHLIPNDLDLTELPQWADKRGADMPDERDDDAYVENRTYDVLRGIATCEGGALQAAVGEETVAPEALLSPWSGYPAPPDDDLGGTLVHETGHLVECLLTPDQQARLETLYEAAFERHPVGIVGRDPDYSVSDVSEYWAEGTAAWFEAGSDASYRRSWLQQNDRDLYELLDQVYGMPPASRFCDGVRATTVLAAPTTFTGTDGQEVVVGSFGRDLVDGADGEDFLCGNGGPDEVEGGSGPDVVEGGLGADDLYGGTNADYVFGGEGDDEVRGGSEDDSIYGGPGHDRSYGDDGNDNVLEDFFSGQVDRPTELGDGNDTLYGGRGTDLMGAGEGDDTLNDTIGTDEFNGGSGRDQIWSVDILGGGRVPPGPDLVDGSSGDDFCTFDTIDVVYSCFVPGEA
ncbi:MAG: calcium-binding protein [Acidimicrobiales bacterium]